MTEQEWRDYYKSPGSIATCRDSRWLLNGCPLCGGETWQVTCDCWAYCMDCGKGYPTEYPFTHEIVSYLDANGLHDAPPEVPEDHDDDRWFDPLDH